MRMAEALKPECVRIDDEAKDKESVLRLIAGLAKTSRTLEHVAQDTVLDALRAREEVGTTGFGNGIAIPHCALEGIDEFVVGMVVHRRGVAFDALDGKPVNVFVFIVGPKSKRNEHIYLLSAVSRVLGNADALRELLSAEEPSVVRENFLRHIVDDIAPESRRRRSLFHVFVQNEEWFDRILTVFSELEGSNVSVIEGNDASFYLHALPLFSGFLTDKKKGHHRLIVATVRHSLANEALRQIASITGELSSATGVTVAVQDLEFCGGSLDY